MKKAVSKNSEMGGALLDIFYSDFREVEGSVFHLRLSMNRTGR